MVATGVPIFMSPVWATLPATNENAALDQVEQRVVRGSVRIVDVIVQRHPRVGDEIERGAVGKADAGRESAPVWTTSFL